MSPAWARETVADVAAPVRCFGTSQDRSWTSEGGPLRAGKEVYYVCASACLVGWGKGAPSSKALPRSAPVMLAPDRSVFASHAPVRLAPDRSAPSSSAPVSQKSPRSAPARRALTSTALRKSEPFRLASVKIAWVRSVPLNFTFYRSAPAKSALLRLPGPDRPLKRRFRRSPAAPACRCRLRTWWSFVRIRRSRVSRLVNVGATSLTCRANERSPSASATVSLRQCVLADRLNPLQSR